MEPSMFWIIIIVSGIGLATLFCFVFFGFMLHRMRGLDRYMHELFHICVDHARDSGALNRAFDEYLSRRNEFWIFYGQFLLSGLVIVIVTILLLTKVINADAGLPILAGIGGFAIGKGTTAAQTTTYRGERG